MTNKRQNQRRRRNQRKQQTRQPLHPKAVFSGTLFKPPNNIRTVAARPWNTYVCQFSLPHATEKLVIVSDVYSHLQLANGLYYSTIANAVNVEIKIMEAQVYGVTDQTLTVIFYDLSTSGAWEQAEQSVPAKNQYARVGFRWPLADSSHPLRSSTDSTKVVMTIRGTQSALGDTALIKVRLLWRSIEYSSAFSEEPLIPKLPSPGVPELTNVLTELTTLLRDKLVVASVD